MELMLRRGSGFSVLFEKKIACPLKYNQSISVKTSIL